MKTSGRMTPTRRDKLLYLAQDIRAECYRLQVLWQQKKHVELFFAVWAWMFIIVTMILPMMVTILLSPLLVVIAAQWILER